jgi:hypothetical protein
VWKLCSDVYIQFEFYILTFGMLSLDISKSVARLNVNEARRNDSMMKDNGTFCEAVFDPFRGNKN